MHHSSVHQDLPAISEKNLISASHWGIFRPVIKEGKVVAVCPFEKDEAPSENLKKLVDLQTSTNRILHPYVRKGYLENGPRSTEKRGEDEWIQVSWEQALDLVAGEIKRIYKDYGPSAMFGRSYGWKSTGLVHSAHTLQQRLLNLCGGFIECANSYSTAAIAGILPYVTGSSNPKSTAWPNILKNSERVVFWGCNPLITGDIDWIAPLHRSHKYLKKLKSSSIKTYSINPVRPETSKYLEDEWLPIRPGTDTALMLALMHELISSGSMNRAFIKKYTYGFDELKAYIQGEIDGVVKDAAWAEKETGIEAAVIRSFAHDLASHRTMLMIGWGAQRARYGEQFPWMAYALACVLGQIGMPGGGIGCNYHYCDGGAPVRRGAEPRGIPSKVAPVWPYRKPEEFSQKIPVASFVDCFLNPGKVIDFNGHRVKYPAVKMVMWTGGNPFSHQPDTNRLKKAWAVPETVVVSDHVWSATARHADIILPASTSLERNDIVGIGTYTHDGIAAMHKVTEAREEAKSDYEIYTLLADKLGLKEAFTEGLDEAGWIKKIYDDSVEANKELGVKIPAFEEFWQQGYVLYPEEPSEEHFVAFSDFIRDPQQNPLKTEFGKFQLYSPIINSFQYEDCQGLPRYFKPEELPRAEDEFFLVSKKASGRLHSQLHNLNATMKGPEGWEKVTVNRAAAQKLQLQEGQKVEVSNSRGTLIGTVEISDNIAADVVSVCHGGMFFPTDGKDLGGCSNTVVKDVPTSSLARGNVASYGVVKVRKAV